MSSVVVPGVLCHTSTTRTPLRRFDKIEEDKIMGKVNLKLKLGSDEFQMMSVRGGGRPVQNMRHTM